MGTGHAGQRAGTKGAAETTTGQRENVDRSFTRRAAQAAEKRWVSVSNAPESVVTSRTLEANPIGVAVPIR